MKSYHWFLVASLAASADCFTTWFIFLSGGHDYNPLYAGSQIGMVWLIHILVLILAVTGEHFARKTRFRKFFYKGLSLIWFCAAIWNLYVIAVFLIGIPCILPGRC